MKKHLLLLSTIFSYATLNYSAEANRISLSSLSQEDIIEARSMLIHSVSGKKISSISTLSELIKREEIGRKEDGYNPSTKSSEFLFDRLHHKNKTPEQIDAELDLASQGHLESFFKEQKEEEDFRKAQQASRESFARAEAARVEAAKKAQQEVVKKSSTSNSLSSTTNSASFTDTLKRHAGNFQAAREVSEEKVPGLRFATTDQEEQNDLDLAIRRSLNDQRVTSNKGISSNPNKMAVSNTPSAVKAPVGKVTSVAPTVKGALSHITLADLQSVKLTPVKKTTSAKKVSALSEITADALKSVKLTPVKKSTSANALKSVKLTPVKKTTSAKKVSALSEITADALKSVKLTPVKKSTSAKKASTFSKITTDALKSVKLKPVKKNNTQKVQNKKNILELALEKRRAIIAGKGDKKRVK